MLCFALGRCCVMTLLLEQLAENTGGVCYQASGPEIIVYTPTHIKTPPTIFYTCNITFFFHCVVVVAISRLELLRFVKTGPGGDLLWRWTERWVLMVPFLLRRLQLGHVRFHILLPTLATISFFVLWVVMTGKKLFSNPPSPTILSSHHINSLYLLCSCSTWRF